MGTQQRGRMDTSIATLEHRINIPTTRVPQPSLGMPTQQELMVYEIWAKNAVESQMYRNIGKESAVMMIILAAREYGIPPAMALNGGLKIINGNVEISARMMDSLIRRAGHSIKIIELTNDKCVLRGRRMDNGDTQEATFTTEDAQAAGLIKDGSGWKKWRQDMLYARALSRLARRLFADVIGVGYVHGEISGTHPEVFIDDEVKPTTSVTQSVDDDFVIAELLENFVEQDRELVLSFIDTVAEHYTWSHVKVAQELMKDLPKTIHKFTEWRNKKNV